jgi:hypothetical protein
MCATPPATDPLRRRCPASPPCRRSSVELPAPDAGVLLQGNHSRVWPPPLAAPRWRRRSVRGGRRADPAAVAAGTTTAAWAGGAVLVLWPPARRMRQADRRARGVHLRPMGDPGDPAGRWPGGRGPGGGADAAGPARVAGPVQLLQPGGPEGAAPGRQRAVGACGQGRRAAPDLRQVPGLVPGDPGRDLAYLSRARWAAGTTLGANQARLGLPP